MKEIHQEFQSLKDDLSKIDTQRGGSASGLKGFYAEAVNATEDNLKRIDSGVAARQIVIDNNGDADAIIRYTNGQYGREIQYKNGYTYSKHKDFLESGKYDNMLYAVNKDNPIFSNPKQLETLNKIAKEHNIKFVPADVSDSEMKILAEMAAFEGGIRSKIGIDETPGITLELYVDSKEAAYYFEKMMEKRIAFNNDIANKTCVFLENDFVRISNAGISQALSAAQFAAALSVTRNTISVVKGDENFGEAAKEVLKDTSTAAVVAYASTKIYESMGLGTVNDATLLVNGTIQITKQIYAYMKGDIDEKQLLQNTAETTVYLTAAYIGKIIGGSFGGTVGGPVGSFIGQFIGEMLVTAICSTVIDTVQKERQANQYNRKMLALAHRAESEIKESQNRLVVLINGENKKFTEPLMKGYEKFIEGLENFDYPVASLGLSIIGEGFGISKEKLTQGHVVRGNIFGKKDRIVRLG